jgi:hypothetical protein
MAEKYAYVVPALATSVAGVTTGLSTEKKKPREAVLALELLAEGKGARAVAEQTGLGFEAVCALRARHGVALEERRKRLAVDGWEMAEGLRLLAKQKMADLAGSPEEMKKVNVRDLVLSYGIAQDKGFAALGEATKVTIEHKGKGVSLEDARAAIEEARARVREASVEVNVTPVEKEQT